ncbi:MAG: MltA domain-containing protein [Desulfobulbaceae bacterium]|nr:MltA domain-containing protein [Desulfobulbaceae bacterium]
MVKADSLPGMTDFPLSSLEQAVQASLTYYHRLPAERKFQVCNKTLTAADQINALENFLAIVRRSRTPAELWPKVTEQFDFCRPADTEMLVTGYYEPIFNGSLQKNDTYSYPLYSLPPDLIVRRQDDKKRVGRLENGSFVPYFSRKEIEKKNLLAGLELIYLSDPFEVFLLHIQGSGRIRLEDGSTRLVRYGGSNGREYTSIGKVLVDRGKLSLADVDMEAIRRYLRRHPNEMEEILHKNDRFIFFSMSEADEESAATAPPGSLGQPLTPGHSVALDQHCYPAGALALLVTDYPLVDEKGGVKGWTDLARFVLNQDSGSAIKGLRRVDLFLGNGAEAEFAAGMMKQSGRLYFLVEKTTKEEK